MKKTPQKIYEEKFRFGGLTVVVKLRKTRFLIVVCCSIQHYFTANVNQLPIRLVVPNSFKEDKHVT